VPVPLGAGLDRVLGQSLRPAQPGQRLSRLSPPDAPDHAQRRQATVMLHPSPAKRGRVASEASRVGAQQTEEPHPAARYARVHPPPSGAGVITKPPLAPLPAPGAP